MVGEDPGTTRDRRATAVALIGLVLVLSGGMAIAAWLGGLGEDLVRPIPTAEQGPALPVGLVLLGAALISRALRRDRAADLAGALLLAVASLALLIDVLDVFTIPTAAPTALARAVAHLPSGIVAAGLSIAAASSLLARHGSVPGSIGAWTTALLGGAAVVSRLLAVPAGPAPAAGGLAVPGAIAFLLAGLALSLETARRRDRVGAPPGATWMPWAAGAVVLLAGTMFWQILALHEDESLIEVTRVAGAEVGTEIVSNARTLSAAIAMVGVFEPSDFGPDREDEGEADRWQARARLLLTRFPDLLAVEVFDSDARPLAAVSRPSLALSPREAAFADVDEPWISPARWIDGEPTFQLVVPVREGRFAAGVVAARTFVESALTRADRLHSIRLSQGSTLLYENQPPAPGIPTVRIPLHLAPTGEAWTLTVAGAPALADAIRSPLPIVALGLAAIIAALVVLSMRGAASEHRKALEIADVNARLEVEVGERRRAEAELRSLNRELDERVRDRTAELARVVDQLAAENRARQRVLAHLERMNASLRQFDAFISHELRQPLGALQIWIDLLESSGGDLSEKGRSYVARARSEIRRMSRMIENELRLSKATHGEAPTDPVALTPLLRGLLADLEPHIEAAGARVDVAADLPAVFVDPDQARQIFGNLIENAVKYRRTDSPLVVRIEARSNGLPSDLCEVVVSDNGRGFEAEAAENLFDAFRRATHDQAGSGLGLAICRRIVEHHGGSIRAEGTPGGGASFYVRLPMAGPA